MHRARRFFSNLTGNPVEETSEIKEEMGDYSLDDLRDLTFPITKNEVMEVLRRNGSSNLLINAIERVPQDTFDSLDDLHSKLSIRNSGASH